MGWVRISDDFYDHRKFEDAGPLGIALWIAVIAWCNRNLTNGRIPASKLLRLLDWGDVEDVLAKAASNDPRNGVTNGTRNAPGNNEVAAEVAQKLIDAGLLDFTEGGYTVVGYLEYQRSAEQIRASGDANAARQARFRAAREAEKSNAGRNGVINGHVTTPPTPTPTPTPTAVPPPGELTKNSRSKPTDWGAEPVFGEFYDAYPKKVGRDDAKRAFTNAINNKGADPQALVAAAAAYRDAWHAGKGAKQLTPGPAPWLNKGYWRDDPESHVHSGHESSPSPVIHHNPIDPSGYDDWEAQQ